ncbi:MAG: outer membrane beta-barrel protein, partial [Rhodoferax sp.]
NVGANLTRLTLGTNYQINANTQWKTEYRVDQSSGYNFLDSDGVTYKKSKTGFATSLVLSF